MAPLLKLAVLALLSKGITAELRGAGHRQLQVDAQFSKSSSVGDLSATGSQVMGSWLRAIPAAARGFGGGSADGKPPPKVKPTMGFCIFTACFALPFGFVGVCACYCAFKIISNTLPFATRADARITSVQIDDNKFSVTRFTFKCLRGDGVMVVVEAEETDCAKALLPKKAENSTAPVLYYPCNPGKWCILEGCSASDPGGLPMLLLFGIPFFMISHLAGVMATFQCGWAASGILGALVGPGVFLGCLYSCCFFYIFPMIDAEFPKRQEGKVIIADAPNIAGELPKRQEGKVIIADAPNIAGLWQLDSKSGSFVYSFQVNGAEVEVKGRQQIEENWGSSCKGGFVEADTLGWNDQDNSHFRLVFRGDECTGFVRADSGEEMEFKGFRMP